MRGNDMVGRPTYHAHVMPAHAGIQPAIGVYHFEHHRPQNRDYLNYTQIMALVA